MTSSILKYQQTREKSTKALKYGVNEFPNTFIKLREVANFDGSRRHLSIPNDRVKNFILPIKFPFVVTMKMYRL